MTSLEFLFNELWETSKDKLTWHSILNKAKVMHKQEIEDAFQDGKWDWNEHLTNGTESKDLVQYYQETFKKD